MRKIEKVQKIEITFGLECDVKSLSKYKSKNLYLSAIKQKQSHLAKEAKMSSRAAKRNTQGGKAFKSKAKGGMSFRAQAAQDAANEMLDLILARENGYKGFSEFQKGQAESAMLEIQVGRISRKFGNGRFEVFCQDNKVRNCALRGLLKRKGQCFVDLDSLVVVTLSEALEELDSSDDEGNFGGGKARGGAEYRSQADQGFIVGIFDGRSATQLSKTRINPRLFKVTDAAGVEMDDLFDRSEMTGDVELAEGEVAKKGKKGKKSEDAEINIDDI